MIFCRNLNIVFIKTKKVGGTSFEIALSKYCDRNDIVTPISRDDEETRSKLGYQKPVNYRARDRCEGLTKLGISGNFRNHIPSKEIYENLGGKIFGNATKIAIHRDPLDFLVSQYFYRMKNWVRFLRPSFKKWLTNNYQNVNQNYNIAPLTGVLKPDIVLRYETLHSDILETSALPGRFVDHFKSLNAKAGLRPLHTREPKQFFKEQGCEDYIEIIYEVIHGI
jgi:hypothetical protein